MGAGGQSLRLVPVPMARLLGEGLRLSSGASSPARGAETLCQTAKKEGTKQKQPNHVGTTCRRGTRVAETFLSHPSCNQLLDFLPRPNCSPATYKIIKKKKSAQHNLLQNRNPICRLLAATACNVGPW